MTGAAMTQGDAAALVRIHSCGGGHAGELARLHASLFEPAWDTASFAAMLADPGTLAFVAAPAAVGAGGEAAACGLIVGRVAADEAEILTLGVARERRRHGIGARLVETLRLAAARRGAHTLYLEVAEGNRAARALYAGLGFEECGRRRGYYARAGAPPEDAVILRLGLDAVCGARGGGGRRGAPHL
jgi:ribosomal-protein-alanine N-acetyltransferase